MNLLIPASSLARLAQLVTNKDEGVTGKTVVFIKEGLTFSARLMEGQYANVDMVMNSLKSRFTVLTNAEERKQNSGTPRAIKRTASRLFIPVPA